MISKLNTQMYKLVSNAIAMRAVSQNSFQYESSILGQIYAGGAPI